MNEFELIDRIRQALGAQADGPAVVLGPGDDAAIVRVPAGCELVSSIDTQVADRHFPANAAPQLIGYRAFMAAASDLAAMGADPGYATVALTIPGSDTALVEGLAHGFAEAASVLSLPIVGGNLAQGSFSITVSVQGYVPAGRAITRAGARPGDHLLLSGPVGGAAAALRLARLESVVPTKLDPLQAAYYRPRARLDLAPRLRKEAHAAVDLSDGLRSDLMHLLNSSGVGAELVSAALPLVPEATLADALGASDDYELCFALPSDATLAEWRALGCAVIGQVVEDPGLRLDGVCVDARGFDHFEADGGKDADKETAR